MVPKSRPLCAPPQDVALDVEEELVAGLTTFFDKGLPQMLLYASEREQYDETIAQQVLLCGSLSHYLQIKCWQ